MKCNLVTINLTTNNSQTLKDVTSITFENVKDESCIIEYGGYKRTLPPAQLVGGVLVPVAYVIQGDGYSFDIKFNVSFPSASGNLFINYLQKIEN